MSKRRVRGNIDKRCRKFSDQIWSSLFSGFVIPNTFNNRISMLSIFKLLKNNFIIDAKITIEFCLSWFLENL